MRRTIQTAVLIVALAVLGLAVWVSENHAQTATNSPSQGQGLYQGHCASCHGMAGDGKGPQASGMTPAPTNFTDSSVMGPMSDNDIEQAILAGMPNTAMPAYGTIFSSPDVSAVLAYLRSLTPSK